MDDSHNWQCEVKPLSQASESDKGLAGEAACGHLAVWLLVLVVGTLAQKSAHQQIHTSASILTHTGHTASRACVHLTALSWTDNKQKRNFSIDSNVVKYHRQYFQFAP